MKYLILLLASAVLLSGCKDEPGPAGPTLTGNIAGKIFLYKDNELHFADESGVKVSIEENNISTITKSDGTWQLSNVSAGIYTLVFSKTGFITGKYYNVQFVGGGTLYWNYVYVSQIPNVRVSQLEIKPSSTSNNFYIQGKISSADSLYRDVAIFFSKEPITISGTLAYLFEESTYLQPDSTSINDDFTITDYYKNYYSLSKGEKLYAISCAMPRTGPFGEYNPVLNTNELITSGILFSNIDSLTIH